MAIRKDLFVPQENPEDFNYSELRDPTVVEMPFTPLEQRFMKEKPQLMPGLKVLYQELGEEKFKRYISRIHNINVAGEHCLIIAESELHRTNLMRECLPAIEKAFGVSNVRITTVG